MLTREKPNGFGNTRLNLGIHLDYLRLFMEFDTFELLTEACEYAMGRDYLSEERIWSPGGGQVYYDNSIKSPLGVRGGWQFYGEDDYYELCLDFSGEFFEQKSNVFVWRMIRGFYYKYKARCSRIDIAIDDYTYKTIPVDCMLKATMEGNRFGFRSYKLIMSGISTDKPKENSIKIPNIVNTQILSINGVNVVCNGNATLYLGSRNSGKMARIYDHDGSSLRYEVEYKRKYAPQVFEMIAIAEWGDKYDGIYMDNEKACEPFDCKDASINDIADMRGTKEEHELQLSKLMAGIAISAVDFRDKASIKDKSKASIRDTRRFYWWQEFIDNIGFYIKPRIPRQHSKTIERSVAWMQKQVAPTMAMLKECMGSKCYYLFIRSLMLEGEMRLSNYQRLLIRKYSNIYQT